MEIPDYEPFYLHSLAELRAEVTRLGVKIPIGEDLARLAQPLFVGDRRIPNRLCAQPIAGNDAQPDGAPGELTRRRYRRYAEGRFGLIWIEWTLAGRGETPEQLRLHEGTLAGFRAMVEEVRAASAERPVLVLQIVSKDADALVRAATLAAEVGFDGVDFQCSRELLPAVLTRVSKRSPNLLLATRLCVYEAVRGGFGVDLNDFRKRDLAKPIRDVQRWRELGLGLLNITANSPRLHGAERGARPILASEKSDEHPLMVIERQFALARELREAVPGLPVVGSGLSWLRQFIPEIAAGALDEGVFDIAGLGRVALADPEVAARILADGRVDARSTCMVCGACSRLREEGAAVGCVLRDAEVYGPGYRETRRFDDDTLLAGAARCHLCEAAPCVTASPTRTDIPAFIDAFRNGDESRASEILRASDPLPELTARFSPGWLESEGACIETALTGTPVPILDLQYAVAWRARERGQAGARVPERASEKSVAIVGGGPTGIAATIRLIEFGHEVHLYEQADRLGGVPERLLATHRKLGSPHAEIASILQPAIDAGRLRLHFGFTLGENLPLEKMHATQDAVLIATGLWEDRSLGTARGVIGALAFLETNESVPERVAILAGGDAAMDAARLAQSRGAKELFIIFAGPRSAMHWHMPESWFATPGVHAMMQWEPLGYETDRAENVTGVRLRHAELRAEAVLSVQLVIEAMGLQAAGFIRALLAELPPRVYTAGALVNGGASVSRCVADGVAAAAAIHRDLSA